MAESESSTLENAGSFRQRIGLGATKVSLNKFDIDLTRPYADMEHAYAEAFEASSHETGINDHVALVIKGRYPARQDMITASLISDFGIMLSLRDAVVAVWPTDNTQRYILVYKRPNGNAALPKNTSRRDPLSEDVIRNGVIRPIHATLQSLFEKNLFHGNIRPDNIFLAVHDNAEAALGECASSIPGINQPVVYETIERGMADPEGKGSGTELDDIYSFGATIAVLLRGSNPMDGKSAKFIIEEKIIRSSFSVLTDGLRLSPGLSEFLRATLNDDPKQRWDMAELTSWVDGNRATPKQSSSGPKAQRALDFNGKKYMRTRMLAKDLYDNVPEAIMLIENGQLSKWLERALGDQETADAINLAISRATQNGRGSGHEDRLLCYVSMALDSTAPIRFKGLNVLPSGIGYSMAMAFLQEKKIQEHGELIRERYAWTWLNQKEIELENQADLTHAFDLTSKMIIRRGIDFGIERCLYELCKSVPCLSPMLKNHYAINCGLLLQGLEDLAANKIQDKPMDRHIACFISVHDSRDNAGLLLLLEGGNVMKKSLALLTLYLGLQKRNDNVKLPGLCEWLMPDAELVAQRFHNLLLKQEIIKQIPKTVKTGSFARVLSLVDNPAEVKRDENDFIMAGRYFYALDHEKDAIQKNLNTNHSFGRRQGRQIAQSISLVLAALIVCLTLVSTFFGSGG